MNFRATQTFSPHTNTDYKIVVDKYFFAFVVLIFHSSNNSLFSFMYSSFLVPGHKFPAAPGVAIWYRSTSGHISCIPGHSSGICDGHVPNGHSPNGCASTYSYWIGPEKRQKAPCYHDMKPESGAYSEKTENRDGERIWHLMVSMSPCLFAQS